MTRAATPRSGLPRGTISSFRRYLNAKYANTPGHRHQSASGQHYQQRVRPYGDYLYHQDRSKFGFELAQALAGNDHKDWKRP